MLPAIDQFASRHGAARFVLAPMSGITDGVFRLLMREMGAHIVISDLVSAEGLMRGGEKTRSMLAYSEAERPVGIQIFGGNPESLVEACRIVEAEGADFVDLNLGCPVKKVVKTGAGSAWLRDPAALGKILLQMKQAIRIPLTIKIRTGWDESSINAKEVVHVAYECGVSWVAIHGRTRAQGYSGEADWELIRDVAQSSPLPILGNGDILTAAQARARIEGGYAHGVMIGRGALKNPWIFSELSGVASGIPDFASMIDRHFELALSMKNEARAFLSLKKFLGWYASGLPGASQFRKSLFEIREVEGLRQLATSFFAGVDVRAKVDDGQPFLMGGHG
ncbi:MAG: tRNA dihydrouridine synthase DusB [Bdellovibrionaceae bacterium]|nr:tRNA dihydrouridine synthase DusB [Bdellovibrionales bacterium]MCB9253058.1 tRNA dihydrouridine synthase DusB [Pseudobdellovibrionaceae bacterium]